MNERTRSTIQPLQQFQCSVVSLFYRQYLGQSNFKTRVCVEKTQERDIFLSYKYLIWKKSTQIKHIEHTIEDSATQQFKKHIYI